MSSRLRAIARDTVEIAGGGWYDIGGRRVDVAESVTAAVAGTRMYLPDEPVADASPAELRTEVTGETTLEAAARVGPDAACLVFASAKNPGGGVLNGAQAQEESLARASALYPCLVAAPDFYAFHRSQGDLRYSDRVIYSPRVPVFRDDRGELLDEPYVTSFLTAAAPNAGALARNQPDGLADVPATLQARARRVLEVAAANGHRRLVLGAWGCGVFRNDPSVVAAGFAAALGHVPAFELAVFAVLDRQVGTPTRAAFEAVFAAG